MEDAIKSFVRLMNDKRYLGPFSLIKNHIPLCKNKDPAHCLNLLYSDLDGSGNKIDKYYLETSIVSNRFKQPINCKFISGMELEPELELPGWQLRLPATNLYSIGILQIIGTC